GVDSALAQQSAEIAGGILVEGGDDIAGEVDALGDLETIATADVRARYVRVGVPEVVLRAIADLDDVAEALGRHQGGFGESTSDECVRGDCGPMREELDIGEIDVRSSDTVDDGGHRVVRGGRNLRHTHGLGGFVENADVGECAADVD